MTQFVICDGSCIKNPGPGGWAYAVLDGNSILIRYGFAENTTNNQMELCAVIRALEELPSIHEVYTDSKYLVDGLAKWIHKWKINGWKTAAKQPVLNMALWQQIDALLSPNIAVRWIPGHAAYESFETPESRLKIWIQNQVDHYANRAARGCMEGQTALELPESLRVERD